MSFLLRFNYKSFFFLSDIQVCKHDLDSKNKVLHTPKLQISFKCRFFSYIFFVQNVVFPIGKERLGVSLWSVTAM